MGGQSDTGETSCDDVKIENTEQKTGPYKCNYEGCSALFKKKSRLKQHMCIHTGERRFKCDRSNCDKAYTRAAHLKRHSVSCHQPQLYEKTFRCPYPGCGLNIRHEFNLKRHFRRKHEKKFICSICNKEFTKNHILRAHLFSHTGETPFWCKTCKLCFATVNLLKRHNRTHKKHFCNIQGCVEGFQKWSDLVKHRKDAHPLELICDVCKAKYKSKGNLVQHIRTHMADRPSFPCPYPNCSRSYSRDIYLKNHIKWKHEGLGHKCPVEGCGRILSTKDKMLKHAAWHEKDHSIPIKVATGPSRKARKDKGMPRRSMAVVLSGIPSLPLPLEKKLIHGLPLETTEDMELKELEKKLIHGLPLETIEDMELKELEKETYFKANLLSYSSQEISADGTTNYKEQSD